MFITKIKVVICVLFYLYINIHISQLGAGMHKINTNAQV